MTNKNLVQEKTSISKRVLITGCSGFFGSHLLRHLMVNTNWDFVCPCSWTHKGTPERVENAIDGMDKSRVTIVTHDLTAPFTEQTKKRIGKIDIILNIASNSHVHRSIENPGEFIIGNTLLAYNMLEFAREVKPDLFLQFSTDEVYGDAPIGTDYKEWSAIRPSNPYSASKSAQEAIAFSYWRTYDVPLIINNVKPVLHKDGVDRPERLNIVGDVEINNLELAKLVAKVLGKELKYEFFDFHAARSGHDRRYALSGQKLKNLGWLPPVDFEGSLRKTIEWTLNHKQWL